MYLKGWLRDNFKQLILSLRNIRWKIICLNNRTTDIKDRGWEIIH